MGTARATTATLVAAAMAAAVAIGGCGQSMGTALPDLSPSSPTSPRNQRSMSSAEQRRAIDDMIAQRDAATSGTEVGK